MRRRSVSLVQPAVALLVAAALSGCGTAGLASATRTSLTTAPATTAVPPDRALLDAAGRGDSGTVARLLAEGPPYTVDGRGRTPLVAAAYGNHVEVARLLVRAGAKVDHQDDTQQSAYLIATSEVGDDPRLLELTLTAGADVDAQDSYDGTGLIRAAERGHPRIVDRLLRAGVEVDHVNRLGWTALLEAVLLGDGGPAHVETVRLLLEAGADHDLPDRSGTPPLAHAEQRGQWRSPTCSEPPAPTVSPLAGCHRPTRALVVARRSGTTCTSPMTHTSPATCRPTQEIL